MRTVPELIRNSSVDPQPTRARDRRTDSILSRATAVGPAEPSESLCSVVGHHDRSRHFQGWRPRSSGVGSKKIRVGYRSHQATFSPAYPASGDASGGVSGPRPPPPARRSVASAGTGRRWAEWHWRYARHSLTQQRCIVRPVQYSTMVRPVQYSTMGLLYRSAVTLQSLVCDCPQRNARRCSMSQLPGSALLGAAASFKRALSMQPASQSH